MENEKFGNGTITITDRFTASKSIDFGTVIMTFGEHTIVDSNAVLLKHDGQRLEAKIGSQGGAIKIKGGQVPVEYLRNGPEAFRIGIDSEKKQ